MKPLGRLICICVGVFMIFFGVMAIKENVELLAISGWEDILNVPDKLQRLITILGQGLNCLVGLFAIIAGLRGKRSIKLVLVAILMMVMPVYNTYLFIQQGGTDFWPLVQEYAVPIFYFIGMLLV